MRYAGVETRGVLHEWPRPWVGVFKKLRLEYPEVLDFITGVLPFTRPILDMIGPDEFLAYTTTHWSTLRAAPTMLGLDSLAIDT